MTHRTHCCPACGSENRRLLAVIGDTERPVGATYGCKDCTAIYSEPSVPDRGSESESENEVVELEPPHGHISHGTARFLWDIDLDDLGENWTDKLGDAYESWLMTGEGCQPPLTRWSE